MSEELEELSKQLWRVKHLLTGMSVKELSPLNLGFLLGEANLLMQQQLTKLSELIVKTQNTETLIK